MLGLYISSGTLISLAGLYAYSLYRQEIRLQNMERKISTTQEKFTNR